MRRVKLKLAKNPIVPVISPKETLIRSMYPK